MFEPSPHRNQARKGTKLILCKQILDKLGGVINFKSSLADETIFYFKVPCRKPNEETIHDEEKKEEINIADVTLKSIVDTLESSK